MSWDKTEGGDFGHSSRSENFIRGLNIELANERNLRATAEAEVERLRAEVNSYNTTLGETISECAANMQEKEQENERLRLYVESITGGLDEAIETVHYLEAENAQLSKVADAANDGNTFALVQALAELDKESSND